MIILTACRTLMWLFDILYLAVLCHAGQLYYYFTGFLVFRFLRFLFFFRSSSRMITVVRFINPFLEQFRIARYAVES